MNSGVRHSAAELVATHLGWDIADMRDARYQATRHTRPALFTAGDFYYCAPATGQKPPPGWDWCVAEMIHDRAVYRAHMNGRA